MCTCSENKEDLISQSLSFPIYKIRGLDWMVSGRMWVFSMTYPSLTASSLGGVWSGSPPGLMPKTLLKTEGSPLPVSWNSGSRYEKKRKAGQPPKFCKNSKRTDPDANGHRDITITSMWFSNKESRRLVKRALLHEDRNEPRSLMNKQAWSFVPQEKQLLHTYTNPTFFRCSFCFSLNSSIFLASSLRVWASWIWHWATLSTSAKRI